MNAEPDERGEGHILLAALCGDRDAETTVQDWPPSKRERLEALGFTRERAHELRRQEEAPGGDSIRAPRTRPGTDAHGR